jgi:hypothetical protein
MPLSDARVQQFIDTYKAIANRAGSYDKPNVRERHLDMAELLEELLTLRKRHAALALTDRVMKGNAANATPANYTIMHDVAGAGV